LRYEETVSFFGSAAIVCEKDLRIELRTREVVTTAGFFGVLVALMAALSYAGAASDVRVAPGTIWLAVAFSSVMAIGRSWQREREDDCFVGLLASPLPRGALFLGKAIGVLAFVLAVEIVIVPVVALVFHVDLADVGARIALILFLGTIGVASTGTLFGAMTVRTRARDLLLATVLFPLLSPTLLCGVTATREIFMGAHLDEIKDWLLLMITFDVISVAGGLGLFGALVED
jgi:heme exporter protein B